MLKGLKIHGRRFVYNFRSDCCSNVIAFYSYFLFRFCADSSLQTFSFYPLNSKQTNNKKQQQKTEQKRFTNRSFICVK